MKRARKKSVKRHREPVNEFATTLEAWNSVLADEASKLKTKRQFDAWVIRQLAGLTALYVTLPVDKKRAA